MSDNIKVAVRMRNLISREKVKDATIFWTAKDSTTICSTICQKKFRSFCYDRMFAGHENNDVVYSEFCSPIVKSVVNGFNGTIFAYGQTSSGKTYTIMGDDLNPGIAYHTVMELFDLIQNMPDREFLLRVSFMEIYYENVKDLLASTGENLKLHEDQYGNIKVNKLTETIVQEPDQVLELMKKGQRQRKTGETKQNDKSSRSHFIFRMIVESGLSGNVNAAVNVSQFNLVDLAGSEKASLSDPNEIRFKEAVDINVSLHKLSKVINQLSKGKEHQFINYRESNLTRILQNSLGGNALTAIICTVTPASYEETLSTLQFAFRAKNIKNKPQVNEILTEQALLKKLANERKRLTEELEATKKEKNQEERRLKELQQQIENLKNKFVTHIAPEKIVQRSSRRETWGGCLDMARMKMMFSSKNAVLFPIENTAQELPNNNFSIKPRKFTNRETISGNNNLSMLEEETDMDLVSESDDFYDAERFKDRFSTVSSVSSKFSIDAMHADCLESNVFVQTNSPTYDSCSETLQESEKLKVMSEKILALQKELFELREYTKLEQRFSDSFFEHQKTESEKLNVTKRKLSAPASLIENKSCTSHDADDSLGIISGLICKENGTNKNAMDLNQEMFFYQFNNVIQNLKKVLCLEAKSFDISDPYLKVIFQLFSLTFQMQAASQKNLTKNISTEMEDMLRILAVIFDGFSSQQGLGEVYDELVSRFTDVTGAIIKEIQLSLEKGDECGDENKVFNSDSVVENLIDNSHFNVPDIINVSSPRPSSNPKETVLQKTFETVESQTDSNEDSDLSQLLSQYQKQISLLEKELKDNLKTISELEKDCDLKEKQSSLFRDKINIQEQIIASLHEELVLKNENQDSLSKDLSDSSTQTYYFSESSRLHSSFPEKELNASIRLSNKEFSNSSIVDSLHHSTNTQQFLSQKNTECFSIAIQAVLDGNSENIVNKINLNESKAKEEYDKQSIPDSIRTALRSILQELSDLSDLTLNAMKNNMPEAYMGEVSEVCASKLDLLDSLRNQVETLRHMLNRIEFFLKDKSDSNEHLNTIINNQVDEIISIQSQCSNLEKNLKEKETQFENLDAALSLFSEDVKERMSQKNDLKIDFEKDVAKSEFSKKISFLKSVIKVLEKFYDEKDSKIPTISEKSMKYTQTVENYPDLDELERVRAIEFKEREEFKEENSSLKLNVKELNCKLEDLKKTLELQDNEVKEIKDLCSKEIESVNFQYEIKEKNWKIQMDGCVRDIEKKYEKELTNQEKEMFDAMDEIREGYLRQLNEKEESYKEEVMRFKSCYEEKILNLEKQLVEEKNSSEEAKLKLYKEIQDYKNNVDSIKLSYYELRNKFRTYIQDVKLKLNSVKPVKNQETQTHSSAAAVKDIKHAEICNECVLLKNQITELKNQAKIENLCKPRQTDSSKDLKWELARKNFEITSLETINENKTREIAALRKEILSKSALLRSCNCRLSANPGDIIKKKNFSSETNIEEASNKCSVDKEISDVRFNNPEDVLQLDVVQKAIEKAKQKEREVFYRAEGPASDIMNLYLKRQLNKKEKEISELKGSLAQKSTNISSENKPNVETASANKILYSKRIVESSKVCQQKYSNLDMNEENQTPCIKLPNPPPVEKVPKVHPKKVLMEQNKPIPPTTYESSKLPNSLRNTEDDEKIAQRLQRLTDDPLDPSNCKQQ